MRALWREKSQLHSNRIFALVNARGLETKGEERVYWGGGGVRPFRFI